MSNYNKILDNKTSLITGCNKGIGKSTVKTFAAAGSNIIACMRKENEEFLNFNLLKLYIGFSSDPTRNRECTPTFGVLSCPKFHKST